MANEYYDPGSDRVYKANNNKELSPEVQKVVDESRLRRELASKENHERLVKQQINAREDYEEQRRQMQMSREFKKYQEEQDRKARISARQAEEQAIQKESAIERAKERYASKSTFYRMFHKKVDYFKTGIGYHDTTEMSVEQIDNLYTGGRGK